MKNFPKLPLVIILCVVATWVQLSAARGPMPVLKDVARPRFDRHHRSNTRFVAQRASEPADTPASKQTANEKKQPAMTQAEVDASARAALSEMREVLTAHDSIRAQIKESVSIGERRFTVMGRYLKGRGLKLRLEFQLHEGNTMGSLLEVCNGQILSTRYKIGDTERITRRDVVQILKEAASVRSAPQSILLAEMGLGGLPALIASLERSMTFDVMTEELVSDRPVTIIQGHWNADYRARFAGQAETDASLLPVFVPDKVRVYIDNQTRFPRRIAYLKRQGRENVYRHMVTLDFSNIELNGPIDNNEFEYVPPEKPVPENITQEYLMMLRQAQREAADKSSAPSAAGQQQDARKAN